MIPSTKYQCEEDHEKILAREYDVEPQMSNLPRQAHENLSSNFVTLNLTISSTNSIGITLVDNAVSPNEPPKKKKTKFSMIVAKIKAVFLFSEK